MRPGISFWKGSIKILAFDDIEDKQEGVLTSAISISLRPKAARERSCGQISSTTAHIGVPISSPATLKDISGARDDGRTGMSGVEGQVRNGVWQLVRFF